MINKNKTMKEHLYDWVFHYNPYTKQWSAIPRDSYKEYWNDTNMKGVIKSSSHKTLLEILEKTEGKDIEKKLNIE